jgi:hypothetical protein
VFPVRYKLNLYIIFKRNSVFKGLSVPCLPQCTPFSTTASTVVLYTLCVSSYLPDVFLYAPLPTAGCTAEH